MRVMVFWDPENYVRHRLDGRDIYEFVATKPKGSSGYYRDLARHWVVVAQDSSSRWRAVGYLWRAVRCALRSLKALG